MASGTRKKHSVSLGSVLVLLTISAVCLVLLWLMLSPGPNRNSLAIGEAANAETVNILIQPPIEFDFKSREEILQLRREAVARYPQLIEHEYSPADDVFGQIEDGLPWWGIEGQFYHGKGNNSITGVSEEARFILNPYLLVAAEFPAGWQGVITEGQLSTFPLTCDPHYLQWKPQEAYAEVTYDAECISLRTTIPFDLIAYNARDWKLNYIFVSYKDSYGITKQEKPGDPLDIPQYIHQGGSCGYPGGCNNMSPDTPEINGLQVTGFPARIEIWLWRKEPASLEQEPDMTYVIHFR